MHFVAQWDMNMGICPYARARQQKATATAPNGHYGHFVITSPDQRGNVDAAVRDPLTVINLHRFCNGLKKLKTMLYTPRNKTEKKNNTYLRSEQMGKKSEDSNYLR